MAGHIILSGGGSGNQTKRLDTYFRTLLPGQARILYLPIAMRHSKKYTFGSCYDFITSIGFKNCTIDMWTDLDNRRLDDVKKYDAIYIGGGNTYSLLDEIKTTNFDKLLRRYISEGGIVYGGSAGAIVLGKDIRTASIGNNSDTNIPNIKNTSGINVIKGFAVHCHHTNKDFPQLMAYFEKNNHPVLALPEPAGIHIHGKDWRVIGKGQAYLVTAEGTKKLNQGDRI